MKDSLIVKSKLLHKNTTFKPNKPGTVLGMHQKWYFKDGPKTKFLLLFLSDFALRPLPSDLKNFS